MNTGGFDIASFLMDSIRGQPKQATYHYQNLSPLTEHTETVENHVFRVHLPDFRSEDIRVQIDKNSMKLWVRCRKPLGQTTVARVELNLDVPKDADIGHIKGNFEQGWLSLSMPKKRITQDPDKKDEEEMPEEKAESGERKKEEKLIPKEKAESEEGKKKDEEAMPKEEQKKSKEEDMSKETDLPKEKIEKDKTEEKAKADSSKEGSLPEGKPTADADNREQERTKQLDKPKSKEEAPSMHEEKPKACGKRQRREGKWEGVNWKGKIEAMEEWLDDGLVAVDKLMESFQNNKKLIYAAAVGFSVGFLVSRTLCSRRT